MPRTALLRDWLDGVLSRQHPNQEFQLEPASADASFRRYFRVSLPDGNSRIVMDAPPEFEDCRPFLQVASLFAAAGVHVPVVYDKDLDHGFLLLSDLGRTTYLDALDHTTAPKLYHDANVALVRIQLASRRDILPGYDRALLERELNLFPEWYVVRHLGAVLGEDQRVMLRSVFDTLLANNLAQAQVFVHRDFHSRNLMVCDRDGASVAHNYRLNPGIIDFQDAVFGPITYDAVSLYRDAYIQWEEAEELDFVIRYWEMARQASLPVQADFHDFYRDYEWMGAQRQLKVLGIFARLCHRDGKEDYLHDMPRVMSYLRRTCERYRELRPLARLLDQLENRQVETGFTF
ncbi:phosphotransferase [Propionivibrio sp.]|uniref:aminoglycoside phosphotransferase family protein n=1 Tax=Propionivibrio sp. TaxID=2212460 RepID=UPI0025F3B9CB|nr:phosphotransferase [Propionivibrio sp.]MBK7355719.1 phosphotransferase [Propionivibrio sp.]MBK8400617.1 phosphotransferase [Propionivibrio sp.]MBK8744310.1 phosphotransferase [Propionivibrio sp.]MBK8895118.1 phosphotransferase [Propionivibrio sp.]MBL0206976.1 phosphotransferase [Propionivibrio sp.]